MSAQTNNTTLTIGLVGFGVVGKGLYDVLKETPSLKTKIKKICIKDRNKKRPIDQSLFTDDFSALLRDDEINVIAELIDDADAAFKIVKASLQKGKAVVSANKKMIAAHFDELIFLQKKYNVPFLYEASCCAGIPIIRNLEEYYDNDLLLQVKGIINGSTNFILSRIEEENISFDKALKIAQDAGFAESDPSLDTEGYDAANKLCILAAHAFGLVVKPADILFTGITNISSPDIAYAREKNCSIRLTACAKKSSTGGLSLFVLPQLVPAGSEFQQVKNEFNCLETESCFADRHFFKGKGAGAFPTAAAVLSDLSALRYGYRYEYKKLEQQTDVHLSADYLLDVIISAESIDDIDIYSFEYIESFQREKDFTRLKGAISADKLKENDWWKQPGVSLLLAPEPFATADAKRYADSLGAELIKAGSFVDTVDA